MKSETNPFEIKVYPRGFPLIGICGNKILAARPGINPANTALNLACCGAGSIYNFCSNRPDMVAAYNNNEFGTFAERKQGWSFEEYMGISNPLNTITHRDDNVIVALLQSAFTYNAYVGIIYAADRYFPNNPSPEQNGSLGYFVDDIKAIQARGADPWICKIEDGSVWEIFVQMVEPAPNPAYCSDPNVPRLIGLMASCKRWPKGSWREK